MKKTNKIRSIAFTLSLCAGPAWSAPCPIPPTNIEPTVQSRVTYDPKDGNYFYEYTLSNSKTSDLPIRRFVLLMDNAPLDPKGHKDGRHIS